MQALGGADQGVVRHEGLDAGRRHFLGIGVRLAEVVRTRRHQSAVGVLATEAPARAHEVDGRVVALRQLRGERRGIPLVAVEPVAREVTPQLEHGLGRLVRHQGIEDDDLGAHVTNTVA